jgi:ComF family protein
MTYPFSKYLSGFSALLFPSICKGCGEVLGSSRSVICRACESGLPKTNFVEDPDNPVAQIFWGRARVENAASVFYYRKGELLQKLIHQLKYKGGKETGIYLGNIAGKLLTGTNILRQADVLVPVPLHYRKQKIRGYNQTELLAKGIHEVTKIPVVSQAVIRTVHSQSQTRRGRFERWQNVEGIFKVINHQHLVKKHILVLDDVVTTGSTLEAFCHALEEVAGSKMSVLTIGYATG